MPLAVQTPSLSGRTAREFETERRRNRRGQGFSSAAGQPNDPTRLHATRGAGEWVAPAGLQPRNNTRGAR